MFPFLSHGNFVDQGAAANLAMSLIRGDVTTLVKLELLPTVGDVIFVWLIIPVVPELIADTITSAVE